MDEGRRRESRRRFITRASASVTFPPDGHIPRRRRAVRDTKRGGRGRGARREDYQQEKEKEQEEEGRRRNIGGRECSDHGEELEKEEEEETVVVVRCTCNMKDRRKMKLKKETKTLRIKKDET